MAKTIYFVDDDKMILNLLEYTFNKDEYNIRTFKSGDLCIDAVRNGEIPDLIVLDYLFEKSDTKLTGLDTLIHIKEINRDIPIIILSSQEDKGLITSFLKEGASKYIKKDSFFIDSLTESIQSVL